MLYQTKCKHVIVPGPQRIYVKKESICLKQLGRHSTGKRKQIFQVDMDLNRILVSISWQE